MFLKQNKQLRHDAPVTIKNVCCNIYISEEFEDSKGVIRIYKSKKNIFVYSGVQSILCCVSCCICLRLVSCIQWCPTHIVLRFCCICLVSCIQWCPTHIVLCVLLYLSSSCFLYIVVSNTCCVFGCFLLRRLYPMLPLYLDCPFLIASLVLSNVNSCCVVL